MSRNSATSSGKTATQTFIANAPKVSLSHADRASLNPIIGPTDSKKLRQGDQGAVLPEEEEEKYVTDPDFSFEFVEKVDEHIKIILMTVMFMATLVWSVFGYYNFNLPHEIFAKYEIEKVFLPSDYWSGIYFLIACPWVSSLYCLFLVVYPDPRTSRFCFKPRRVWRWVPYFILVFYTVLINSVWLYKLFLIPANIHRRMTKSINGSLKEVTRKFPKSWEYVQNYYQCCGIRTKEDWTHKTIPLEEIPFPFKNDQICKTFFYGKQMDNTPNCNLSQLGLIWPASCCNNVTTTTGCTTLQTSTEIWTGHCYSAEIALALTTICMAMMISIAIAILGLFAFFKTRILETIALRQKRLPPESHI